MRSKEFLNKEQFDNLITIACLILLLGSLNWALWMFKANENIVMLIIGAEITAVNIIFGFRWGSSRNANRQQETIENLVNPTPGTTILTTTQDNEKQAEPSEPKQPVQ